jgi:threonyl-tRNA synthetase
LKGKEEKGKGNYNGIKTEKTIWDVIGRMAACETVELVGGTGWGLARLFHR